MKINQQAMENRDGKEIIKNRKKRRKIKTKI